ncbi:MAG TPA: aliphatic sulfonate ABC transporter substrate-binding protein [Planctomycetota bacterium]|nr:aliphatic sulfonate ABC transporter substrate-binding protein [Planctomycetota bacterium]
MASATPGCGDSSANATGIAPVRLGYFANMTHAQALIGVARGDFQKGLGNTPLQTSIFNAGPSAIEALSANKLDIAYIGPGPALNAFVNGKGNVRVVAGSAANGVGIVVAAGSGIKTLNDLKGKRIATPQLANTQDIAAREFVLEQLHDKARSDGGTTEIQPVANAEQVGLFKQKRLDAAWAPEPWASRLIHETGATLLEEEKNLWPEKKFAITLVVVSKRFLDAHPEQVEAFLKAHAAITEFIQKSPEQAAALVNEQLNKELGKPLSSEVLKDAFARVKFTTDPLPSTIERMAQWNVDLGFLRTKPDLSGLVDLSILKKLQTK